MQTLDFTPELRELEQDYQILTELDRSAGSRTYLARHLRLNRDVTITLIAATSDTDRVALTRFAGDVKRLMSLRHPNVIPVIEGRRLPNDQFAVVRARVRGSSLNQLVSAVGPIPQQRVASILDQVRAALEWARDNAIADRHVAPDAMIFQQGSGRVLLSFDLAPGTDGSASDECDDARTVGSLGWEMLSGQQLEGEELRSLADLRPDLSRAIVDETNALVHCWRGGPSRDIAAYVALLAAGDSTVPGRPLPTPVAPPPSVEARGIEHTVIRVAPAAASAVVTAHPSPPTPVAAPIVAASTPPAALPPAALPLGASEPIRRPLTVGTMPATARRWGFGARFASAVAIIAVLAALGFLLLQRRSSDVVDRSATGSTPSTGQAAGEIESPKRTDPSSLPALSKVPTGAGRRGTAAGTAADVEDSLSAVPRIEPETTAVRPGFVPPGTRRHEPPRASPAVTFPVPAIDSGARGGDDLCNSPSSGDQHRCLMRSIDANDTALNSVYGRLISALRAQAKAEPDAVDSDAIERLRTVQRNWLDVRDQRCHSVGSGPLYARDRARCFANESARRTRELTRQLDAVKGSAQDTTHYTLTRTASR